MPNDDLRADINAAFDAAPDEPTSAPEAPPAPLRVQEATLPVETTPETPPEGETQAQQEARLRDEKGRFAPGKPPVAAKPQEAPAKPQEPAKIAPTLPVESIKAPQSWKPTIREHFAKLAPEVQQEVIRREREIAQTLQETTEARQGYQRFRETMAPFEHMIRAEGADPYQTVSSLMRTAMALQTGASGTKAGIVANLIKHYGVDVSALANALDGQPMPQQPDPAQYRDPRVDQLLSQVEQAKRQREYSMTQEATRLISEVEQEEFFGDVRDAMADILEIAAKRGVAMTPRDAYNRAVWADPHVAEVLQQRQAAQRARNPAGSTQRAAAAASSVRGSPAVGGAPTQPDSLRGDIEAAMDRLRE